LSLLRRIFRRKQKRAFYEGGRITKANRDFWNATSPFEVTASMDRDRLRARARWLHANNPIMANIDKTIVNNVVGHGIALQSKTGERRFDEEVERLWRRWAQRGGCDITGRQSLADMLRMVLETRMVDGEILAYLRLTGDSANPLKIQLIEADRFNRAYIDPKIIDGVEIDDDGRPVAYHVLAGNPYDPGRYEDQRLPADDTINYFTQERATQYRGVSEYARAIIDIKNFSAYQSATITAARARANVAYYVEREGPIGPAIGVHDDPDDTDKKIQEINGVMVHYLERGEKMGKLDPDMVGDNYANFVRMTVRMLANARNISYELAFRDFSQVNFSSARASIIQDNKRFDAEQRHLVEYFLAPVYEAWLEAMVLSGNLRSVSPAAYIKDPDRWNRPRWVMPKREWVDPLKDMKAIELELKLGLTTRSEVAASRGMDFEEMLIQQKKEQELMKKYGIGVSDE